MADRWVVDASVLAAVVFKDESYSAVARAFVVDQTDLIAPDLIALELANVAAKKVWRGDAGIDDALAGIEAMQALLVEIAPALPLASSAFRLAAQHRFSAYDATYLALAEAGPIAWPRWTTSWRGARQTRDSAIWSTPWSDVTLRPRRRPFRHPHPAFPPDVRPTPRVRPPLYGRWSHPGWSGRRYGPGPHGCGSSGRWR